MDDCIESTIGDAVRRLARPQTPAAATGVLRLACLHDDNGILADAARSIGLDVVYVHQSGDDWPAEGEDISVYDHAPPFDLMCVNLPEGAQAAAFTLALRFLRVRRPAAFLILGADYAGGLTERILVQAKQLTYRTAVHVRGSQTIIVGTLDDDDVVESALWQVAETATQ